MRNIGYRVHLRNRLRRRITCALGTFEAYVRYSIVAPASASWRGNFFASCGSISLAEAMISFNAYKAAHVCMKRLPDMAQSRLRESSSGSRALDRHPSHKLCSHSSRNPGITTSRGCARWIRRRFGQATLNSPLPSLGQLHQKVPLWLTLGSPAKVRTATGPGEHGR